MTDPAASAVGRRVAVASFTMVALRLAFRSIGFVSTLILVRLLRPDDFGLVGLATAVFGVFELLTEMSMQMALIRLPQIDRRHMDTAWTMNLARGVIIGGLVGASSGMAADWMHDARVTPILWVLAAAVVMQGFENIGMVAFRRELQYQKVFEFQLFAKLAGFCITIPCAWAFRSYWALVAGIVASRLFGVAYSYVIQSYRPRLSLAAFHELFHFSKWFLATNVLMTIETYTATLLFSRIGGPTAVGLYQVSWQIGSVPTGEIGAPIRDPLYAGYAKVMDDTAALRRHFVASLALVLMIITPMSIGLGLTADLARRLLLGGADWEAASELIRLCAFYALFDFIGHFTHNIFVLLNRQRRLVVTYAPVVVLRFAIAIWAGLTWGITAAVWVLMLTAALNAVMWTAFAMPLIELSVRELLRPIWRTAAAALAMTAAVVLTVPLAVGAASFGTALLHMLMAIAIGATTHVGTQALLWLLCGMPEGPERRAQQFIAGAWRWIGQLRTLRPLVKSP